MPLRNIVERLHPSLRLEGGQEEAPFTQAEVQRYEKLLSAELPAWYLNFFQEYGGFLRCEIIEDSRYQGDIYIFSLGESMSYFLEHVDGYEDYFYQRMPIGNDLGNRVLYYSARPHEVGIHVSYNRPEEDYWPYLAPNLEAFLFDGEGLEAYADF